MSIPNSAPAPDNEQHFDLGSWLILLFAISIVALSAAQVIYRLSLPTDGWGGQPDFFGPEQQFIFDRNLSSAPSPLYNGDILLAVEGQPVGQALARALTLAPQLPTNWKIGGRVAYTVYRDGRVPTLPIMLDRAPTWVLTSIFPGILFTDPSVIPSLLISVFLFLKRPRNRAARLLLLLSACFFASDALSHPPGGLQLGVTDLFYVAAYWPALFYDKLIWNFIIAPIYVHLFLVFPVRTFLVRRIPGFTFATLYLSAPVLMLLAYLSRGGDPLAFWSTWSTISQLQYFVTLVAVVILMGHALIRKQEPEHRAQIRWVAAGTLITSLGALVGGVLAMLGMHEQYPLISLFLYRLPFLAFPLGVTVAVLRYRMFDVDVIINRTLVYIPLTAILAGLYAACITLTQRLFVSFTGEQSDVAAVLTTLMVVAAFSPIKDRLQTLVDKRFKEEDESSKRLRAFEKEIQSRVGAVEARPALRRLLNEAAAAFGAACGEAYVSSGSELKLVYAIGELEGEPEVKTPVEAGGTRIGVIYLGKRARGKTYNKQETDLLKQVASTIAEAIKEDAEPGLALAGAS